MTDEELYFRAALSGDSRFDGWIYIGVTSTGIYCRPTCPATTPKRANMRFFRTAGAAQAAGFRACKRCRPDAAPGSPEWNIRADLAGRAMRLIADGLVDREGVSGLAARLNYSERQLRRQLVAEVGAGPLALARAQRARTAQLLLETTELPVSEVAFAAGFASIRQFNGMVREVFALTPTEVRTRAAPRAGAARVRSSGVILRLPFRLPMDLAGLLSYLGERAVPGVEEYADGVYRRALSLPHGTATISFANGGTESGRRGHQAPGLGYVRCELHLQDMRDLTAAVQRCRRLLDLDADPVAVDAHLARDPLLAPLIARAPGARIAGCVDADELALRTALEQGLPTAATRQAVAHLVARCGKPLTAQVGGITHTFPSADTVAGADLTDLPLPAARRRAVQALAAALASGELVLDAGAERDQAARRLARLDGLDARTVGQLRMRALGDPDVFLPTHTGAPDAAGATGSPGTPEASRADRWRPWRSYAWQYLSALR